MTDTMWDPDQPWDPEEPPRDLAWPLRLDGGDLATVEQDSLEEIRGGLLLACELRPGDLPWDEDLGIPDPLGATDPAEVAAELEDALREIDPRESIHVTVLDTAGGRSIDLQVGIAPDDDSDDDGEVDIDG